MPLCN